MTFVSDPVNVLHKSRPLLCWHGLVEVCLTKMIQNAVADILFIQPKIKSAGLCSQGDHPEVPLDELLYPVKGIRRLIHYSHQRQGSTVLPRVSREKLSVGAGLEGQTGAEWVVFRLQKANFRGYLQPADNWSPFRQPGIKELTCAKVTLRLIIVIMLIWVPSVWRAWIQ